MSSQDIPEENLPVAQDDEHGHGTVAVADDKNPFADPGLIERQVAWLRSLAGTSPAPRAADPARDAKSVLQELREKGYIA